MLIALLYVKNKLNFCFVKYEGKKQTKKKQAKKRVFFYISTQCITLKDYFPNSLFVGLVREKYQNIAFHLACCNLAVKILAVHYYADVSKPLHT